MDARRLREETRAEHEATEAVMPLMGAGLTRARYVAVLRALEPVVTGWEEWAAAWAPRGWEAMVAARRRGALLRADLRVLGGERDGEVGGVWGWRTDWMAVVTGDGCGVGIAEEEFQAAFLGALYVMEGSRLGGRYLARHVEAELGLTAVDGEAARWCF